MLLPPGLEAKIRAVWKEKGDDWADQFDHVLSLAVDKWNLSELEPFPNLSFHFVAKARRGSEIVVLKLGIPEPCFKNEAEALRAFKGGPVVKLLDWDGGLAAMLLHYVDPGIAFESTWSRAADHQHTLDLCRTMVGLWREPPNVHQFESTRCLFEKLAPMDSPLDPHFVSAKLLWVMLEETSQETVLLHGDLHHGNVLRSADGFTAIDPMGVVGDPAFDIMALLHNPVQTTAEELVELLADRLQTAAQVTGLDCQRLVDWGYCGNVLSLFWDLEDGGSVDTRCLPLVDALRARSSLGHGGWTPATMGR